MFRKSSILANAHAYMTRGTSLFTRKHVSTCYVLAHEQLFV